ncbi:MAG: exosortase E/protease, VPEID-CTERM system [Pseudomonadota bacterium]
MSDLATGSAIQGRGPGRGHGRGQGGGDHPAGPAGLPWRWIAVAGLSTAQLFLISFLYNHHFVFTCEDHAPWAFCTFAGRAVLRGLSLAAALGLLVLARPQAFAPILEAARRGPVPGPALRVQLAGFALLMAPWFALADGIASATIAAGFAAWIAGGLLAAFGMAGLLAPWSAWREGMARASWALPALILLGLFMPEIADRIRPLWHVDWVTRMTFDAVVWFSALPGYDLVTDPPRYVIGAGEFFVAVGVSCSGVEGFALISAFLALYMGLFRAELSFPHVLILLPIGIALSWMLNVVRISALLWLGFEVSPQLAVDGFHSHAGWLLFTLLALGLIAVSRLVPWFRRAPARAAPAEALPPLLQDWNAARLLPFIVFMASALVASTFSETPGIVYPARAVAMGAVLWLFRAQIAGLAWRLDPLALGTGAAIGALWIVTAAAPAPGDPLTLALGGLGTAAFAVWAVARIVGTSVLVPLIEELFFRSYLLDKLGAGRSLAWTLLAVAVSTAAFAGLHGRWLEAGLAGLVFAWLALRPWGRLTDAVVSHGLANALIALHAVLSGQWSVI